MALPSPVDSPTGPEPEVEGEESSRKVSPFSEWMGGARAEEEGAPYEFADPRLQAYGGTDAEDPNMWMHWFSDKWYWPGAGGEEEAGYLPPGLQNWQGGGVDDDEGSAWNWVNWVRDAHANALNQQAGGGGCAGCSSALAQLMQGEQMLPAALFAALAASSAEQARASASPAASPSESPKQSPGREARNTLLLANMLPPANGSNGSRTPTTSAAASPSPSPSPVCKGADWLFAAATRAAGGEPASSSAAPRGVSSHLGSSTMSIGSLLHPQGICKPCAWFHKTVGCVNGADCKHCHVCPEGALKNKKKAQQAAKSNRRPMIPGLGPAAASVVGGASRAPLSMPILMSRLNSAFRAGEAPQEKAMLEAIARATTEAQHYMAHREPSQSPVGARSPPPPPPPPVGSPGASTTTSKVALWLEAGSQKHQAEEGPVSFNIPANSDQGSTAAPGSPSHNNPDENIVLNLNEALGEGAAASSSAPEPARASAAPASLPGSPDDEVYACLNKSLLNLIDDDDNRDAAASSRKGDAEGSPLHNTPAQWQVHQSMPSFGPETFWAAPGTGSMVGSMWPMINSSAAYGQHHASLAATTPQEPRQAHQIHAGHLQDYLNHLRTQHTPDELAQEILPKLRLEILVAVQDLYKDRVLPVSNRLISRLREVGWSEVAAKAAPFLCARWPQTFTILPPFSERGGQTAIILCSEPHWFKGWVKSDSPDTYSKELWDCLDNIVKTQVIQSTEEFEVAKEIRSLAKDHLLGKQPLGEIAHMLRLLSTKRANDSIQPERSSPQPQSAEDLMKLLKSPAPKAPSANATAEAAIAAATAALASTSNNNTIDNINSNNNRNSNSTTNNAVPAPSSAADAGSKATTGAASGGNDAGKALLDLLKPGGEPAEGHGTKRGGGEKGGKVSSIVGASLLKANPRVGDAVTGRTDAAHSSESRPAPSAAAAIATITTPAPPPPRPRRSQPLDVWQ